MSYIGETLIISCFQGGLVMLPNDDMLSPNAMVNGSKNVLYKDGGRKKRGGTRIIYSASGVEVSGIFQFMLKGGNNIITFDANGVVKKNQNDSIGTMASGKYPVFEVFKDTLYIVDGETIPQLWDGNSATLTALDSSKLPTDWAGTTQPSWIIKHGRGASEDLFAGGVQGKERFVYVGDDDDFSDDCVTQIVVNTGDGFGPVAAANFNGILWVFGKRKTFYINDSNVDKSLWVPVEAPWLGGAAHNRLVVRTPNDLVCMMEDGEIYSVIAVQESNDYKRASLTRPAGIDDWIRNNLNLSKIEKFHSVYDPVNRLIKFFVVRGVGSSVDTALVYNIDRPPDQAWAIHDNLDYASGYNAASSILVKDTSERFRIYTGGTDGNIWDLETKRTNDDGNGYEFKFATPFFSPMPNRRVNYSFAMAGVTVKASGNYNLNYEIWIDAALFASGTINLMGVSSVWGPTDPNAGVWGPTDTNASKWGVSREFIDKLFDIGSEGKRIKLVFSNSNAEEDIFVTKIFLDFKPLGTRVS